MCTLELGHGLLRDREVATGAAKCKAVEVDVLVWLLLVEDKGKLARFEGL